MSDALRVPFIFVKHGDPPPLEWMAAHPGWVKFPAVMIPRDSPDHPANGGRYPTFPLPAPAPVEVRRSEAQEWPFGRPVSLGLRGTASWIQPGNPPQYPGGHGAPPESRVVADDPIGAYLRASTVFEPRNLARFAAGTPPPARKPAKSTPAKSTPAQSTPEEMDARERAFLRLLRWAENENVSDDVAYHARYGNRDPMTDEDMQNYVPKPENFKNKKNVNESYTAAGAYQITRDTWNQVSAALGLTDFTPASQDLIATYIIEHAGAREYIRAGAMHAAYQQLYKKWSSLPGGKYNKRSESEMDKKFQEFYKLELHKTQIKPS